MNYWKIATSIEGHTGGVAWGGYLVTKELSRTTCGCRVGEHHAWWSPCEKHHYWINRLLCRWTIRRHRKREALALEVNDES